MRLSLAAIAVAGLLAGTTSASGPVAAKTSSEGCGPESPGAGAPGPHASAGPDSVLLTHFSRTVPVLLDSTGVPGAAVGLVVDGRVTWKRGFGRADLTARSPVTPRTVFNAGSISKTLTAWGVLRLVESGRVELDASVNRYLRRWTLTSDSLPVDEVTVRRLLAHTGGLSLPSVAEYGPDEELPTLVDALSGENHGPELVSEPGTEYRYSGGGYMVLQLLLEEVTGRSFSDYMREEILLPLGMESSAFAWRPELRTRAATPYDHGEESRLYRFAGKAAASLNTTLEDLLRLGVATLGGDRGSGAGEVGRTGGEVGDGEAGERALGGGPACAGDRAVLRPETVRLMLSPQPGTAQFGGAIRNGLGYALWRLADGSWSAGHAGQNTGWAGVFWLAPESGDGIVVLTNASGGRALWRWMLCDWAERVADTTWRGLCTGRPQWLPDPPEPRGSPRDSSAGSAADPGSTTSGAAAARSTFVDSLLSTSIRSDEPGAALIVRHHRELFHASGYGRTAPDSGLDIGVDTPFYLASLSKPVTAALVLRLVERGSLALTDPVREYVPGLPAGGSGVTIRHLLTHSSGIPDYYAFLEWSRLGELDNAAVLDTLRRRGEPAFRPGSRHEYSNSNYVLLAEIVRRATGSGFADALRELLLEPAGLPPVVVLDEPDEDVPGRAPGWAPDSAAGFRTLDYRGVDVGGFVAPLRLATVGAGGLVASARAVDAWSAAFFRGDLVADSLVQEATTARIEVAPGEGTVPELVGYGYGWYVSRRYGGRVVWHDGDFVGYRTIVLHVPSHEFTVTLLANRRDLDQRGLAVRIADRFLAAR